MSEDFVHLNEILERIQRVEAYTQAGKEAFFQSVLIQDGVIRNFEVMGEAVKQLSLELRQNYPDVPWRQIAGFRDVLIHHYMGLDLNAIWNVVEQNLPNLKQKIERILQESGDEA